MQAYGGGVYTACGVAFKHTGSDHGASALLEDLLNFVEAVAKEDCKLSGSRR